jgi:hypothetical protein
MSSILIEDGAKPPKPPVEDGFDLQDGLILAGVAFAELAAALIWWKAAIILAAIFCLGFAWLIERAKSKN